MRYFRLILCLWLIVMIGGGTQAQEDVTEEPAPIIEEPTLTPSVTPTLVPTATLVPTLIPTAEPTATLAPTDEPTATLVPTEAPTLEPTATLMSTEEVTEEPTAEVTPEVTVEVTEEPTLEPTVEIEITEEAPPPGLQNQNVIQPQEEMIFEVNSTADPGDGVCDLEECTLREAIIAANDNPGADTIIFDINGGGPQTIQVLTPLPAITDTVTIDGTTQLDYTESPLIILDGALLDPPTQEESIGLDFQGGTDSILRGLAIVHFDWIAVRITGTASKVVVESNYIGVNVNGTEALPNLFGVVIVDSSENRIGGPTAASRNLISGNQDDAINIDGEALGNAGNNLIEGNYIGVDVTGTLILSNDDDGVKISSANNTIIRNNLLSGSTSGEGDTGNGITVHGSIGTQIENNIIGLNAARDAAITNAGHGIHIQLSDTTTISDNIISGNTGNGIYIQNSSATQIEDNIIGLNAAGDAIIPNQLSGVRVEITITPSVITTISGNTISGNAVSGIELVSGGGATITNNRIGTDITGTVSFPNIWGVHITGSANNLIGGPDPADRNIISGNIDDGINISGASATGNVIQGNYIGLDITGTVALGNDDEGVRIDSPNNIINGNVISGNTRTEGEVGDTGHGIMIRLTSGTMIQNNRIGTNAAGDAAIPNGDHGIYLEAASNTTITANVISGNTLNGIMLQGGNPTGNVISDNLIGLNASGTAAIPNLGDGVSLMTSGTSTTTVTANRIYGNGGLGINLGAVGVTPNDEGDLDTGPNLLQNFPDLNGAKISAGDLTVTGQLDTLPDAEYRIEFFANDACDSSGHGEGQNYLGFVTVTTDDGGFANINFNQSATTAVVGQFITATATDSNGNTSEFSACIQASEDNLLPVADAGADQTVIDTDGNGSEEVTLDGSASFDADGTITDYLWTDDESVELGSGVSPTVTLPLGIHEITLTVTDNNGGQDTDTVIITVTDAPDCAVITFTGFNSFGVVEFSVNNPLDTPVLLDAISINWVQRAPGVLTLDQVTVGGTGPDDAATTIIWQGVDDMPPTLVGQHFIPDGNGTWIANYSFPAHSTTPLYLDFNGTDSTLDVAFGVDVSDFNGTRFQLDCGESLTELPIADAGEDQTVVDSDASGSEEVTLDGLGSVDPDGTIVSYTWRDADDNILATEVSPTVDLAVGEWELELTVVDDDGAFDTDTVTIIVEAPEPQTYVVNSTADPGDGVCDETECTLREAIDAANTVASADTITFNIPGAGPHTIQPLTQLPTITDTLIIDGTSQPDYVDAPVIELDGQETVSRGLILEASNSIIRGLAVNRFSESGIWAAYGSSNTFEANYLGIALDGETAAGNLFGLYLSDSSSNTVRGNVISGNTSSGVEINENSPDNIIEGNLIGTNASGTAVADYNAEAMSFGIVAGGSNTTIGGETESSRNIISGNYRYGVLVTLAAENVTIQGNYIGTDITGTFALGNESAGLHLEFASNITVSDNVISGNANGILVSSSGPVTIDNNYIGTDATGTAPLGNTYIGVYFLGTGLELSGSNTTLTENIIAYNFYMGVGSDDGVNNRITANRIFANELVGDPPEEWPDTPSGLGIDLGADGVTPNDPGDADTGANNFQNFPELATAVINGADITITGTLNSTANTEFRVEFFANSTCDPSGHGEGEFYLGFAEVTTDANGDVVIDETLTTTATVGQFITATAMDPDGNTSEFSACVEAEQLPSAAPDNLVATADSATAITLTWADNSSDETAFAIERSPDGANDWVEIHTTAADVETYTDTGLTCETEYFYRVRAARNTDYSDYSNIDSATTFSCVTVQLRTPRDNSHMTSARPVFRWQRNQNVVRYRFELATDTAFTNVVLFRETANNRQLNYQVPRADALSFGIYYWRVMADSGNGTFAPSSTVFTLTVTPRLPAPPRPLEPRNNTQLNDTTPTLTWQAVKGGAGEPFTYEIWIDNDARFRSPDVMMVVSGLDFTSSTELSEGRWYWRVRAINNLGVATRWGARRSFIVDTTPTAAPTLRAPKQGTAQNNPRPNFTWTRPRTAVQFQIQIDNNADFGSPEFTSTGKQPRYRPTSPLGQDTYYWRVRAYDKAGNVSAWSAVWEVHINLARAPRHNTFINSRNGSATPNFTWTRLPGASQYELQIADGADFSTIVFSSSTNRTNYRVSGANALANGIYYWRVRPNTGSGFVTPDVGIYNVLTVSPPAPGRVRITAPRNNATVTPATLIEWNEVTYTHGGSLSYRIQVSDKTNFSNLLVEDSLVVTHSDALSGLAPGTYFVRVRTENQYGRPGNWSPRLRLRIPS